ncbi:MAG: HAD-IA family hydrolase [Planctomycetota bacterium]
MNDFASVRAVVFDAVGTLIYPNPPAAVVYQQLGLMQGSGLSEGEIASNFKSAIRQYPYQPRTNEHIERARWRRIVADVFTDLDDTESLFGQLWDHFARSSSWAVFDDVADALRELHTFGLVTAIGSNFDDRLSAIVPELAPLDQTQATFVSSQLGFTKPAIEFFRAIEAELQLHPHELLMVGDDARNDIAGAAQAGWHGLLLDRAANGNTQGTIQSLRELASSWA